MTSQDALGAHEIARDLRRQIGAGELAPGQALPSRPDLMKRYQVARATIDRAIEHLVRAEVVESRQGAGTWVRAAVPGPRLAVIGSPLPAHDLPATGARITSLGYAQVASAADRRQLLGFDGLLWNRPEAGPLEWAGELAGQVPQVLINRTVPGMACVSTDHRSAYHAITAERLAGLPHARPFFLRRAENPSVVSRYREEGFTAACREAQRFHEQVAMPGGFDDAVAQLRRSLAPDPARPLLVVSDSRGHTGAVMVWARSLGLRWRHDLWYSDFDNDFPADVWGVEVTSFIQLEAEVHAAAVARLCALVAGRDDGPEHTLVAPRRRDGAT